MTSETSRAALLDALVKGYEEFKQRLTIRLGSAELACEALQDTFLRLSNSTILESVRSPRAYVLRAAFNIAINRLVAEKRRATSADLDELLGIADDAPDQARVIEACSDVVALRRALCELPQRRREIVVAVALNEVPIPELAKRFGVTVRTIQIELRHALLHCAERLDRRPQATLAQRRRALDLVQRSTMNGAFAAQAQKTAAKAKN